MSTSPPLEVSESSWLRSFKFIGGGGWASARARLEPALEYEQGNPDKKTGFVPVESPEEAAHKPAPAGFVPQKTAAELEAFKYFGCYPEDMEKYAESLVNSPDDLPGFQVRWSRPSGFVVC